LRRRLKNKLIGGLLVNNIGTRKSACISIQYAGAFILFRMNNS